MVEFRGTVDIFSSKPYEWLVHFETIPLKAWYDQESILNKIAIM